MPKKKVEKKKEDFDKSQNRRGPLSGDEKKYIRQHSALQSVEDIARELSRNPKSIKEYIKSEGLFAPDLREPTDEEIYIVNRLKSLEWWSVVEQQFDDQEITLFERLWVKLYQQFDEDVLASEEIQIKKYITFEILKDRALKKVKQNEIELDQLNRDYKKILRLDVGERDKDEMRLISDKMSSLRTSESALNREYNELSKEQGKIQSEMAASRNDRIKNIQDASKNWSSGLKLLEDIKFRHEIGKHIELMRVARDKEMVRLTQLHKFVDNEYDYPILSGQLEDMYQDTEEKSTED